MKSPILLLVGMLFAFHTSAQNPPTLSESFNYGGSGADYPYDITPTSDGGYLISGSSTSVNGDVGGNYGGSDVWIAKTDASGAIIWEENFGGSGNDAVRSVAETPDGAYVMLGYTASNDVDVSQNNGLTDLWLIKVSSSGTLIWEKTFGGTNNDYGIHMIATADGGFAAIGNTDSSDGDVSENNGDRDLWVTRHDAGGDLIWEKTYGGSLLDAGLEIFETATGNFIVTGSTASSDGDVEGNHGENDAWTMVLSSTGDIIWQRCTGGSDLDFSSSLEPLADGSILVSGQSASSDGDLNNNQGGYDLWVFQLDASGELIWSNSFGGSGDEFGTDIMDAIGSGYILSGNTKSADGDVSSNNGDRDGWLVRVDDSGSLLWERAFGGSGVERILKTIQKEDGSFYVLAHSNSSDGDLSGNNGNYDFWLINLNADPLSITEETEQDFSVFPNPVNSELTIRFDNPAESSTVSITDMKGRLLWIRRVNTSQIILDMSKFDSGVYIITLDAAGQRYTKKIVVQGN